MDEYQLRHTTEELDAAIDKVQNGYILPSGTVNIAANGNYDVKNFAAANVNVPAPVFKFAEKEVNLSVKKYSSTSYSASSHVANVDDIGFTPKFYIFSPWDYNTANNIVDVSTTEYPILSLAGCFDSDVRSDCAAFLSIGYTYYDKASISAGKVVATKHGSVSIKNTSLKLSPDGKNVYFYINNASTAYPLSAGKWRLQLVGI